MKKSMFVLIVLFYSICAMAQPLPPPILLPIQNIPQKTIAWCWAAVVQQIVLALEGPARTPRQCALVAIAYDAHPDVCCTYRNKDCIRTGNMAQVKFLIEFFGGRYSEYATPTDPLTLYRTLAAGMPVILKIRTRRTNFFHVVVLRGMSFEPTLYGVEPVLYINDPASYFTKPVTFSELAPLWKDALVVSGLPLR